MLKHTSREVQQLQVCINKFLLSLVTHHNLLRPRNHQPESWIPTAFLPLLQRFLRVINDARIEECIIWSMPQLSILIPFIMLQKLFLENDESLPTLAHHRGGKRHLTVVDCNVSKMVLYAWVSAVVNWLCFEDLWHASETEVHNPPLSHHNYNAR